MPGTKPHPKSASDTKAVMSDSIGNDAAGSLTAHVAEFVANTRYGDIPAATLHNAKRAILDTMGAGLAGVRSERSGIVQRYISELNCNGAATVFGTAMHVPPRFAALANATAMHVEDYDDVFHASRVHPSTPVLAAVCAESEQAEYSGKDLLTAFSVGSEVTCKLSQAIDVEHYQRGYHATSTCGVFGVAAAISNLRRFPLETTRTALGIAGSEAAGLRENFGTMVKPLHAGRAAESGLVAASLAALGFSAAEKILEGPRGFFIAGGGGYDETKLRGKLGNPWSYTSPGVSVRPFPSGNLAHPAMCKLQELVIAHDIKPEQVAKLLVKTNRLLPVNLNYHRPATALQGKFSMEFCLASILTLRRAGLAEFSDAVLDRTDIQRTIDKIDYTVYSDAEAKAEQYTLLTTFLEIVLNDGRRFQARVDAAKGSASIPMSEHELAEKFRECAAFAGRSEQNTENLIELIMHLEDLDDARVLMRAI